MDDIWTRFVENMAARVTGPMKFRLLLQPTMASILAIRWGLADARAGKPPYFWALFSDPANRVDRIKDRWTSIGKVFVMALILDVVCQAVVTRFVYPGEAIITAFVLAIVPYLILRDKLRFELRPDAGEDLLTSQVALRGDGLAARAIAGLKPLTQQPRFSLRSLLSLSSRVEFWD